MKRSIYKNILLSGRGKSYKSKDMEVDLQGEKVNYRSTKSGVTHVDYSWTEIQYADIAGKEGVVLKESKLLEGW